MIYQSVLETFEDCQPTLPIIFSFYLLSSDDAELFHVWGAFLFFFYKLFAFASAPFITAALIFPCRFLRTAKQVDEQQHD